METSSTSFSLESSSRKGNCLAPNAFPQQHSENKRTLLLAAGTFSYGLFSSRFNLFNLLNLFRFFDLRSYLGGPFGSPSTSFRATSCTCPRWPSRTLQRLRLVRTVLNTRSLYKGICFCLSIKQHHKEIKPAHNLICLMNS